VLAGPAPPGGELGGGRLGERGRDGREFLREFEEGVAQAVPEACPREQGPQTFGRAVEAIGEDPFDPIRRLPLQGSASKLAIGLGQGCRTGLLGVAQVPEHAATDNRWEVHFVCETATVLFVRQEIDRQRQSASRQYGDQTLVAQRTDEAVERHGRDIVTNGVSRLQTKKQYWYFTNSPPPLRGARNLTRWAGNHATGPAH